MVTVKGSLQDSLFLYFEKSKIVLGFVICEWVSKKPSTKKRRGNPKIFMRVGEEIHGRKVHIPVLGCVEKG